MGKALGFLLTLAVLLFSTNSLNWQGTGNMTQDNMTVIWNYINTNFQKTWTVGTLAKSNDKTLVNFTIALSDYLNSQWNQAWNVVVVYLSDGTNSDTVVYGYAFRNHWMWYNSYKMNDGHYVSFIIWKDYNCIKWQTFNNQQNSDQYATSYTNPDPLKFVIANVFMSLSNPAQVWLAAKSYADGFASDTAVKADLGSNIAFSVIMSQSNKASFFGKFCAKNYLLNLDVVGNIDNEGSRTNDWGRALILQMR